MFDYLNPRFLLCYLPEKNNSNRIENFCVTNDEYRIIAALADRKPDCQYEIFCDYNEVLEYLDELLDFEDKFLFGIARGEKIILNEIYTKK